MAYRDFTLNTLEEKFSIINKGKVLFSKSDIVPIAPDSWLSETLEMGQGLRLRSEKARSEAIVSPILFFLRKINANFFTIHSGEVLNVDKENGLNGECDFLLSQNTGSYTIDTPIISVVEAKKHDLDLGINQCTAQMYGSALYNRKKGKFAEIIYGCVTTGSEWRFLKLENNLLSIDEEIYTIKELPTILGIFQRIIDYYKAILEPVEA